MGIRSTFRAASYLTLGLLLARTSSFFQFVVLARALPRQELGDYALCYAMAWLLAAFSAMGVGSAVTREAARNAEHAGELVLAGLPIRLAASLVTMCIGIAIALTSSWRSELRYIAIIFSVTSVPMSLTQLNEQLLVLQGRARTATVCQAISSAIEFTAVTVVVLAGFGVVAAALSVMAARSGLGLVTTHLVVRRIPRPRPRVRGPTCLRILAIGWPVGLSVVLSAVYSRFDTVILSAFKGGVEVAIYATAASLVTIATMVQLPMVRALFPFLTREHAKDPATLLKAHATLIKILAAIGLPVSVLGALLIPVLIPAIYGAAYWRAAECAQVLIWTVPVLYINGLTGLILLIGGAQKFLPLGVAAGAAASCILNVLFIPGYGYLGAAVAAAASRCIAFAVLMYLSCKYVHRMQFTKAVAKPAVATVAMALSVALLQGFGLAVAAVGASVVFLAAFWALRPFTREEISMFRKALGLKRPAGNS